MALETGTYISDLVATNPTSTDPKSAGDDHLRLLKSTIKTTFPNVTGAVNASHTELSLLTGKPSVASQQDVQQAVANANLPSAIDSWWLQYGINTALRASAFSQ